MRCPHCNGYPSRAYGCCPKGNYRHPSEKYSMWLGFPLMILLAYLFHSNPLHLPDYAWIAYVYIAGLPILLLILSIQKAWNFLENLHKNSTKPPAKTTKILRPTRE